MKPDKKEIEEWKVNQQRERWNRYMEHCREMHQVHKKDWDFYEKNKPIKITDSRISQVTKLLHNDCIVLDSGVIRL